LLAPGLERALVGWCARPAEARGVEQQPEHGEVREALLVEDPLEIRLDPGRTRKTAVVAADPEPQAVGRDAPERAVAGVEVFLKRVPGAAAPPLAVPRDRRLQLLRRHAHDDGHPAAERFERDPELAAACLAAAGGGEVSEPEDLREELADEGGGRGFRVVARGRTRGNEVRPQRLRDAPVARDLVAQLEALR